MLNKSNVCEIYYGILQILLLTLCKLCVIIFLCTFIHIFCFGFGQKGLIMLTREKIERRYGKDAVQGSVGPIVTADTWSMLASYRYQLYKILINDDSTDKCFVTAIAYGQYTKDARLAFGAIDKEDGQKTAHLVLVKDGWIFDPNNKLHVREDVYKEMFGWELYQKQFVPEQGKAREFLNHILFGGYRDWCSQNNVEMVVDMF